MLATAGVPANDIENRSGGYSESHERPIREADIVPTDCLGLRGRQLAAPPLGP